MEKTWIVVADRSEARLFELKKRELHLVDTLDNPEGRHRTREDSDRPGRAFDSHGRRHAFERHQTPQRFAKQIADALSRARTAGVGSFVLVAEPGFLGELRSELDAKDEAQVVASLNKDLMKHTDAQLREALGEILPTLTAS